jgi:hypothetical protein
MQAELLYGIPKLLQGAEYACAEAFDSEAESDISTLDVALPKSSAVSSATSAPRLALNINILLIVLIIHATIGQFGHHIRHAIRASVASYAAANIPSMY